MFSFTFNFARILKIPEVKVEKEKLIYRIKIGLKTIYTLKSQVDFLKIFMLELFKFIKNIS